MNFTKRRTFILFLTVVLTSGYASLSPDAAIAAAFLDPETSLQCSPDLWTAPTETGGEGVQALLKSISITTRWTDVPVATKVELQKLADDRLAAFRERWGSDALSKKQTILLECPTPEMTFAMDEYYRKSYDTVVPKTFSLKGVKSVALARALVRNYLGTIAAARATLHYPKGKLLNRDWDGRSSFDSIRLPDKQTYEDIKKYNMGLVEELRKIDDASLDEPEKALKQRALFDGRAHAVGAFSGDSFGGADLETPCEMVSLNYDIIGGYELDKGRPEMFASDEVLRETNALYLNNIPLKRLDVGTLTSALKLALCDGTGPNVVQEKIGNPATNEVAKGMILLKKWWIERVSMIADAQKKCTVYSAQDRTQIWEAFSADQHFNNDGSLSMDTYKALLTTYRDNKIALYREAARLALRQVFPDDAVLTPAQRQKVLAAINMDSEFGLYVRKISAALDAAQSTTNGPAAMDWGKAITANVTRIGGYADNDPVRADDQKLLKAMFEEVKSWVASQYQGYPIDIAALYPSISFSINTTNNATTMTPGKLEFGIGTKRSKMEYYSILIHELRHAVYFAWQANAPDKSTVKSDEGPTLEGSGVAVEALLLAPFLKQTLKNDTAYALYALDYGIRDARYAGTTDATLQKYLRSGCSGLAEPNTIDFTKTIAADYGLTGDLADNLALRSHAGTQYFQYIWGGLQVLDAITYLQSQVDPNGQHRVDPFVLFACGLNTPQRNAEYVSALKACMKF